MKSAFSLGESNCESLGEFGASRTRALCSALGFHERDTQAALALFRVISNSWAACPVGAQPPFRNDITDDGTPFEFSVGFEAKKPELRLLFESQLAKVQTSARSSWAAGLELQHQLRQRGEADTTRFDSIAALFAPPANDGLPRFSLWHAAVLRPSAAPLFKAYLNPEIMGVEHAATLVGDALGRLNMSWAWRFVQGRLGGKACVPYMSLDLEASRQARVKIYLSATHADAAEGLLAGAANFARGDARGWLRRLTGNEGDYTKRPLLACLSFTEDGQAPAATLHVPVRSYLSSDEEALLRTTPLLPQASAAQLESAMTALAMRPLSESRGVLSYVSLRPVPGRVRVTTYLSPGAYSVAVDPHSSGTHPAG